MKKNKYTLFLLSVLILLAFISSGKMFVLFTSDSVALFDIEYFIKYFFLYIDSEVYFELSSTQLFLTFCVFLFSNFVLISQSVDLTCNYRSMTFIRLGSKKRFFVRSFRSIARRSLLIIILIAVCFTLSAFAVNMKYVLRHENIFREFILFKRYFWWKSKVFK